MTARSTNFSAVNCFANFEKTTLSQHHLPIPTSATARTQTWCEQSHVQVRHEFLLVGIEHALSCDDVTRQTNAHNLHHSLEDEEDQMSQWRMRIMIVYHARREEGEVRRGGDGRAIVASNCVETVRRGVGEETHFGVS